VLPVLGQLDDLTLIVLVGRSFLWWCPAEVVAEHMRALRLRVPA